MLKMALTMVAGAALGWLYYRFIGCSSGTCPITANAWSSTLYGAVLGLMMGR